jgi:hypothetical protein
MKMVHMETSLGETHPVEWRNSPLTWVIPNNLKVSGTWLRLIFFSCGIDMLTPVDAYIDPLKDLTPSEMWVTIFRILWTSTNRWAIPPQ